LIATGSGNDSFLDFHGRHLFGSMQRHKFTRTRQPQLPFQGGTGREHAKTPPHSA
jgi:hypothetical protein